MNCILFDTFRPSVHTNTRIGSIEIRISLKTFSKVDKNESVYLSC